MLTVKAFLYLLIVSVTATSEEDYETVCGNYYRDLNNTPIVVSKYCSNKLCIEKCCRKDEIFFESAFCINKKRIFKNKQMNISHLESEVNYSTNILSSWYKDENLKKNFVLVHNQRDPINCTSERNIDKYEILKDGSLLRQDTDTKEWVPIERLQYCIDYKLHRQKDGSPTIKIIIRQITVNPKDKAKIVIFETVGVMISSFFLLLVLIVYCLLPELKNLSGLVLMAYTFSLLTAFVTKLVITFKVKTAPPGFCKQISPVLYFFFVSSIFWLSVISFDVWSGLRRFRIKRGSKREELVRFLWYALYAWGAPLLITAIVTTLDNVDISYMGIAKPPFESCLHDGKGMNRYFRIPIGILIIINIILFFLTVYNIWIVKHAVRNTYSSKTQNAKYSTFVKLSAMMGVSWCMELIDTDKKDILCVYILINVYNIFTGVALFYLFVWEKKILASLCRKFDIRNEFTKKLDAELSQRNKSCNTKSTFLSRSTVKSNTKDQNQDPDLVQISAKEESTLV